MSITTPGLGSGDPLCSDEAKESDEAFDAAIRARAADPLVRRVMATLNEVFEGDGYAEDEEGFRWLVVDASRIVAGVEFGREQALDRGWVVDDHGYILDAMYDSGRWAEHHGHPVRELRALADAISGATPDQPAQVTDVGSRDGSDG